MGCRPHAGSGGGGHIVAAIAIPAYSDYKHKAEQRRQSAAEALDIAKGDSGAINANGDLPTLIDTNAGKLAKVTLANGKSAVTINGKALFSGEDAQWQSPLHLFNAPDGREYVLMTSTGGRGNSCESLFFFLVIDGATVTHTPEFGTCAPQGSYRQNGGRITITLPKMGGQAVTTFDGAALVDDGNALSLNDMNDPAK